MQKRITHSESPALIFVYNAESGLFNAVMEMTHKAISPQTYRCNLCALTYSTFGMRKSWKRFLKTLERPLEFLHADELKSRYGISGVPLPAIFKKEGQSLNLLIDRDSINACKTTNDLKRLCEDKLCT